MGKSTYCLCRNQAEIDQLLPRYLDSCARDRANGNSSTTRELRLLPLLEDVKIQNYLGGPNGIEKVLCGGDSNPNGELLKYEWVRHVRVQCIRAGIVFDFISTGSAFSRAGKTYKISKMETQLAQARKSWLSYVPKSGCADRIPYTLPDPDQLWSLLAKSKFRSRFHLDSGDIQYVQQKGMLTIRNHAENFVRMRLAVENPAKDGKQTPMKGHPVFKAQHATGCCCRECLEKWHHIPAGKALTEEEQAYIVDILMKWISRESGMALPSEKTFRIS